MDGSCIFLSIFNWRHSLHSLKYKWTLWLEFLRLKGSYINGGDFLWLLSGFSSRRGVMDNQLIPRGTKPASLKPVYFCRWSISISQLHLWKLWGEDQYLLWLMCLDFGNNIEQSFMETHCSFYIQTSWPPRFELTFCASLDRKPSRRGRRKVIAQRRVWWIEEFVVILITPSTFCSCTQGPLLGVWPMQLHRAGS